MQAMMISPTTSSIIYPNGSPSRSPKGVMDMIVFQPSSPPKMPDISSFHGDLLNLDYKSSRNFFANKEEDKKTFSPLLTRLK